MTGWFIEEQIKVKAWTEMSDVEKLEIAANGVARKYAD